MPKAAQARLGATPEDARTAHGPRLRLTTSAEAPCPPGALTSPPRGGVALLAVRGLIVYTDARLVEAVCAQGHHLQPAAHGSPRRAARRVLFGVAHMDQ
jgi:hypothetical protein